MRTLSAGVHVGILESPWTTDGPVTLKNARRIWRWKGANTLNEIATSGIDRKNETRISNPAPLIQIIPIEVIPVSHGVDLSAVWNG